MSIRKRKEKRQAHFTRSMSISLGEPSSYDPKTREVDAVISTGAAVRRNDWDGEFDEVLRVDATSIRMDRLNSGCPLIDSHCWYGGMDAVLGAVKPGSARIERGSLVARFKISRSERGERIAQDLQDGIPLSLSAGYIVHGYVSDSKTTPSLRTVTDWEPIEVSVVPVPAEASGTGFRSLSNRFNREPKMQLFRKKGENDQAYLARILAHLKADHPIAGETDTQMQSRAMSYMQRADKAMTDEEDNVDGGADEADEDDNGKKKKKDGERALPDVQQQTQNVTPAQSAAAAALLLADVNMIGSRAGMTPEQIATEFRAAPTIEGFRARAFDIMAASRGQNDISTTNGGQQQQQSVRLGDEPLDGQAAAMAEALMIRMHSVNRRPVLTTPEQRSWAESRGLVDNVTRSWRIWDQREEPKNARVREYLGMSIVEMAAAHIGYRGKGMITAKTADDILKRAYSQRSPVVFQSTTDFSSIFENVLNKVLLDRYQLAMPTYREVAVQRNFVDFRPHAMVRTGDFPLLQELAENGELRYASTVDSKEVASVKPYGIVFAISRQMMINDDLSAIDQILGGVGDGVLIFENNTFWTMFVANPVLNDDSKAVWTYGTIASGEHNNYLDTHAHGADSPSVATLSSGRQALMGMKSKSGNFMNVSPSIILTGPQQQTNAELIVATITPALASAVNPFSGKLRPVTEAQLTGLDWYLLADPQRVPNWVYGFLNGATGPRIRSDEPFGVQGLRVSVEHDFGVGAIDWRGTVRNSGLTS